MCQFLYMGHLIIPAILKIDTTFLPILQRRKPKPRRFKYCTQDQTASEEKAKFKANFLCQRGFFMHSFNQRTFVLGSLQK